MDGNRPTLFQLMTAPHQQVVDRQLRDSFDDLYMLLEDLRGSVREFELLLDRVFRGKNREATE